MTYGCVTQRNVERAMLGITLHDRVQNELIRRRTKVVDVGEVKVGLGRTHVLKKRRTLETPARQEKSGQTTSPMVQ
ncbi:unnamed protein product, partial [Iphiclides podalirius]